MITEGQKTIIRQYLKKVNLSIKQKRDELDKLRIKGEDKISSFMEAGDLPESFNDPELIQGIKELIL